MTQRKQLAYINWAYSNALFQTLAKPYHAFCGICLGSY